MAIKTRPRKDPVLAVNLPPAMIQQVAVEASQWNPARPSKSDVVLDALTFYFSERPRSGRVTS